MSAPMKFLKLFVFDYDWRVVLYSPLSRDGCLKKLEEGIARSKSSKKPVYGSINGHSFCLNPRGYITWYEPILRVQLVSEGTHTKIMGYFSTHDSQRILSYPGLIVVIYLLASFLAGPVFYGAPLSKDFFIYIFGMLLFYGVGWFYMFSGGKAKNMIEFLKNTLEATETKETCP